MRRRTSLETRRGSRSRQRCADSSESRGSDTAFSERPNTNKYSRATGKAYAGAYPGIYPLIGTPDDIVEEMVQLEQAGLAGAAVVFLNYLNEMPYFNAEVLPRMERRGLRERMRQLSRHPEPTPA